MDEVYTIEIIPELAERSARLLAELGYTNIRTMSADGVLRMGVRGSV